MNLLRPILLTAALTGLSSIPLLAEGALRGRILDEQGRSLPGVAVKVRGPQGARSAESDAHGGYQFYGLPPGRYEILVTMDGFSPILYIARIRENMTRTENFQMWSGTGEYLKPQSDLFIDLQSASAAINFTHEELEPFAIGRTLGDWVEAVRP